MLNSLGGLRYCLCKVTGRLAVKNRWSDEGQTKESPRQEIMVEVRKKVVVVE
jgi:hypothetical protein